MRSSKIRTGSGRLSSARTLLILKVIVTPPLTAHRTHRFVRSQLSQCWTQLKAMLDARCISMELMGPNQKTPLTVQSCSKWDQTTKISCEKSKPWIHHDTSNFCCLHSIWSRYGFIPCGCCWHVFNPLVVSMVGFPSPRMYSYCKLTVRVLHHCTDF